MNSIFIAQSLDGYISDRDDRLDWLHAIPNPEQNDMGFTAFMERVDGIIMGRRTFEVVCSFDIDWPYSKPVFVWSTTLTGIPEKYQGKAFLVKGGPREILDELKKRDFSHFYIDGGSCIRSFLEEDLIDEMIVTTIPVLLGGGAPLFSTLAKELHFELIDSGVFLGQLVQSHYRRKK